MVGNYSAESGILYYSSSICGRVKGLENSLELGRGESRDSPKRSLAVAREIGDE